VVADTRESRRIHHEKLVRGAAARTHLQPDEPAGKASASSRPFHSDTGVSGICSKPLAYHGQEQKMHSWLQR